MSDMRRHPDYQQLHHVTPGAKESMRVLYGEEVLPFIPNLLSHLAREFVGRELVGDWNSQAAPAETASMKQDTHGPGVPKLLEHLAAIAGESVYLWLKPDTTEKWRVWTGVPSGSGGGEWGSGSTPYAALQQAFERLTDAIFYGRKS